MNFKKILIGSAIAATTFGFIACGGDSSSPNTPVNPNNPDAKPIDIPKQSALSPVIFENLKITPMSNGQGGTRGSLSGMIKLDDEFIDTSVPYTEKVDVKIDSVGFAVGKVVGGTVFQEKVTINLDGVVFPIERVSLSQKFFEYSALSDCGDFKLYIFVYSSSKEADLQTSLYTSVDTSLTFNRPEQECQAALPPSSSSPVVTPCSPVTPHPFTLSNSMGTSQSAINFETGLADNPHITIKFANDAATIIPGAGVTVYEDNSQTTGLEAEVQPGQTQICREDFRKSNFQFSEELTSGLWLDVIAADGKVYPVLIKKFMSESATKGTLDIIYYN